MGGVSDDDIDAKLARISARIEQRATDARSRLDRMGFADAVALRDTFSGGLRWLSDADGTTGSPIVNGCDLSQPGCVWTDYTPPKRKRDAP
jgi:hypothetical protein